jgi:hypothetical protein
VVISNGDVAVCQIHKIRRAPRYASDPFAVVVFLVGKAVIRISIKPNRRTVPSCLAAGIRDGGINKDHSTDLEDSHQQHQQNGQNDREFHDCLGTRSGWSLISRMEFHKVCFQLINACGAAARQKKTLRPLSGSRHPRGLTLFFKVNPCENND